MTCELLDQDTVHDLFQDDYAISLVPVTDSDGDWTKEVRIALFVRDGGESGLQLRSLMQKQCSFEEVGKTFIDMFESLG